MLDLITEAQRPVVSPQPPLVVDLDGTLIAGDLLAEAIVAHLADQPLSFFKLVAALQDGKAALKHVLAEGKALNAENLPYNEAVLSLIRASRSAGQPVYLATASHHSYAQTIAARLDLFDGVFATTLDRNLSGANKATLLIEKIGTGKFDYVGNSADDLWVWQHARRCYAVNTSSSLVRRLRTLRSDAEIVEVPRASWRTWLRMLRVHQYAKNALIFLPAIAAHSLQIQVWVYSALAFVSFSLAASAIYIVNDLVDIADDRVHPTKRLRPLAQGVLSVRSAVTAVPPLLIASFAIAALLSPVYLAVLLSYLLATTAYSFWLKRKMLIDVILLAVLYGLRVVAGGAATGIVLSNWLLAMCLFAFTSLALIKRYTELLVRIDKMLPDAANRNYRKDDLPVIAALAAATGTNTITVLTLYIASPEVANAYHRPQLLWLLCPLLLFVLSRALLVAHRRLMTDDPVAWAIKDRVCRAAFVVAAVDVMLGIFL